jgi:hypothetical protein
MEQFVPVTWIAIFHRSPPSLPIEDQPTAAKVLETLAVEHSPMKRLKAGRPMATNGDISMSLWF